MRNTYNNFAGQSIERLAALSDGIFAVAMTLLVLELHVPNVDPIHSEGDLWAALGTLAPHILIYFMSFLTLGIFWVGQQAQFNNLTQSDRTYSWIQLIFLLTVSVIPFATSFLAEFITYRIALGIYWLNLLLLGVFLFTGWRYAVHAKLLKPEVNQAMISATNRRIVIYQALYALAVLLCFFSTYLSIGILLLLQLNSVMAPRIKWLDRF